MTLRSDYIRWSHLRIAVRVVDVVLSFADRLAGLAARLAVERLLDPRSDPPTAVHRDALAPGHVETGDTTEWEYSPVIREPEDSSRLAMCDGPIETRMDDVVKSAAG